jgi:hypothetical protein
MDRWEAITNVFGIYFLALFGWQAIETKRLIDLYPDWTGDGQTTISDVWGAWITAWETPAQTVLGWVGPDFLRFFELEYSPQWLLVPLSLVAWTVIALGPFVALVAVIEMIQSMLPKKKG